jgi:nitrogen regulation protein NR(I)
MSRILVVDDEPNVLKAFADILATQGHEVVAAQDAQAAFDRLKTEQIDVVVMDVCMPGTDGLEALGRLRQRLPKLPVIIMTGHGTMGTAVEATKRGAFDYQLKPFEPSEMLATIERALQGAQLVKGDLTLGPETAPLDSEAIIGRSAGMQQVYKAIGRVAQTDATVLIRGESGTGKELVARAIYQHSLRSEAPLLVINCVAIPETLLESELLGHARGAFTGAVGERIGKFEQANKGTVFLDEIGDIPLGIQAKILRVLQERSFERVGSNKTIRVDVRVLAATNRDLEKAIAQGSFREDLYHRLDVVTVDIPPLRERPDDIPELVEYFLARFARELRVDRPPLAKEARELLQSYAWPGNVRELENCIQRVMIFTRGYPIQAADIAPLLRGHGETLASQSPLVEDGELADLVRRYLSSCGGARPHERLLDEVDRLLVSAALRRTKGNQTHAAKLLGLPRPTLHAKIQKHNLRGEGDPANG